MYACSLVTKRLFIVSPDSSSTFSIVAIISLSERAKSIGGILLTCLIWTPMSKNFLTRTALSLFVTEVTNLIPACSPFL